MRTNIVIDDELMREALAVSGCRSKKEAVEQGLRLLVARGEQRRLRELRGQLQWQGELDELRGEQ